MTDLQIVIVVILAAPFWLPVGALLLVGVAIGAVILAAAMFRATTALWDVLTRSETHR